MWRPRPTHGMFGPDAMMDPVRDERERADPNPVVAAFMDHGESVAFSRDRSPGGRSSRPIWVW